MRQVLQNIGTGKPGVGVVPEFRRKVREGARRRHRLNTNTAFASICIPGSLRPKS